MKLITIIIAIALVSFSSKTNDTTTLMERYYATKNLYYSDWSSWKKVSCYKGIEFRTKRGEREADGTYMWYVQFRNNYSKQVGFNYNITEPEKAEKVKRERLTLGFWSLSANEDPDDYNNPDSPHASNYIQSSNDVFVYITNLRYCGDCPTCPGNCSDRPYLKCDY